MSRELGLGLVGIGRSLVAGRPIPSDAEVETLLGTAIELGVRVFDTAASYGLSEARLGRFLRGMSSAARAGLLVATKCGEQLDGDGRADFVHLGRGKSVTLHRGREAARYPAEPDLVIPLEVPIENLAQVRIEDLDGDGRADLAITRPGRNDEPGVLPPVTLDLHLTGGGAGR